VGHAAVRHWLRRGHVARSRTIVGGGRRAAWRGQASELRGGDRAGRHGRARQPQLLRAPGGRPGAAAAARAHFRAAHYCRTVGLGRRPRLRRQRCGASAARARRHVRHARSSDSSPLLHTRAPLLSQPSPTPGASRSTLRRRLRSTTAPARALTCTWRRRRPRRRSRARCP
jgi:hypothetical protein